MAEEKNLKVQIDAALKRQFDELCERKNIKLKDGVEGMIHFLLSQHDFVQSVILGQVKPDSDILATVFKRKK